MKLLARLMSHGFAVALVVLLAIGFIYRGELFPEWKLPDFLVFDSAKSTADNNTPAGKVEPAPVQGDWMASETATEEQQAPDAESDITDTAAADVSDAIPSGEGMAESGTPVTAGHAPADADAAAEASEAELPVEPAAEQGTPAAETTKEAVDEPVVYEVQESIVAVTISAPEAATDAETANQDAGTESGPATAESSEGTGEEPSAAVTDDIANRAAPVPETVTAPVVSGSGAAPAGDTASTYPGEEPVAASETPAPLASDVADRVPPVAEAVIAPLVAEADVPAAVIEDATPIPSAAEAAAASRTAVQDTVSPAETGDAAMSSYELLSSAREAYWLRDYQAAEDFYRRMIMDDPYNPDGYGELANMYFSQGNWEAASSAYYEAGLRLVRDGMLAPARELVEVIRGLNGSQADALEETIQAARENAQ